MFGRVTGKDVKRLPSSVYWNGLGVWGIRRVRIDQATYERTIDQFHRRSRYVHKTDEGEEIATASAYVWHPNLPPPPDGFPEGLDFDLTQTEAGGVCGDVVDEQVRGAERKREMAAPS